MMRVLPVGFCLVAIHAGSGIAQTLASATDSPVTSTPMAVEGPEKMANNIPEIIRSPEEQKPVANVACSLAACTPAAVLQPPTVNLEFPGAIRPGWDQVDETTR